MAKNKPLGRCCALNDDGHRCRKRGQWELAYHGDSETYFDMKFENDGFSWVEVALCRDHGRHEILSPAPKVWYTKESDEND